MAAKSKYEELLSKVHGGVPLEKSADNAVPAEKVVKSIETTADADVSAVTDTESADQAVYPAAPAPKPKEPTGEIEETAAKVHVSFGEPVVPTPMPIEPSAKPMEKRKRKPQADYQDVFFTRIDFTHRKPLYITAQTHRRLMRIVHLMDESKATISSYVENIVLNHLDTFKEDINTIYQSNNLNPTE